MLMQMTASAAVTGHEGSVVSSRNGGRTLATPSASAPPALLERGSPLTSEGWEGSPRSSRGEGAPRRRAGEGYAVPAGAAGDLQHEAGGRQDGAEHAEDGVAVAQGGGRV